jgi:hypothetical protein
MTTSRIGWIVTSESVLEVVGENNGGIVGDVLVVGITRRDSNVC